MRYLTGGQWGYGLLMGRGWGLFNGAKIGIYFE